jgi:thiamine biosynthesis lipoprotein
MGTVFTLVAYGTDREYLAEVATEVFDEIDQLDGQMSNYQPTSELSRINREAARGPVLVEPRLFRLIQDAAGISAETDGAFDITVGPLMKTWGFFRGRGQLPAPAEIAAALKHVGYRNLELNSAERTLRFQQAGMEIDLGGIAKGYAIDQAVEILRSRGIRSALVSSGASSIYALGSPPGERGWQITVRSPYDARKAGDTVRLQNFSLSISGDYERFFRIGGKLYCHIMDPHTGRPVENTLATVVLAERCTETDALSTAFFVMGKEGTRKYLSAHPNLVGILYQPAGPSGAYRRVVLRSPSYNLPPDALVELEAKTITSSPAPKH